MEKYKEIIQRNLAEPLPLHCKQNSVQYNLM